MATALYRRYRPETFAELIGQSQVTDPLRTALRSDRVGHAYLFSGPRGCGKTTSARVLARCLNCAEGPTDTPCGVCPSCVELARDGGGSLDVVEIDAASHNGVDDARELRERAVYAPARDRFKIFILDEAHMVTPQGFNALLKLVEEPPEHVKFIFATTEPDKVIGTIRSRTHHYPFRLVPPGQMLDYLQELCVAEQVEAAPGVLPLVVRAGGGSVRDTLSILDQLIAGSDGPQLAYAPAVALLGYTPAALLDEVVSAIAARDAAELFSAVDRVIQNGQDPRRFVEDLLERLRDLIVVSATGDGAGAILRGVPDDEIEHMRSQAAIVGPAELSRAADLANAALTELSGATSPRIHLELLAARLLVPSTDSAGTAARLERLERRIGIGGDAAEAAVPVEPTPTPAPRAERPTRGPAEPVASSPDPQRAPASEPQRAPAPTAVAPEPPPEPGEGNRPEAASEQSAAPTAPPAEHAPAPSDVPVTLQQIKDAWPEILGLVEKAKRSAWLTVYTATPRAYDDQQVLTLGFLTDADAAAFRPTGKPGSNAADYLRTAIEQHLGVRVRFLPRADAPSTPEPASPGPSSPEPVADSAQAGWAVAKIPGSEAAAAAEASGTAPTASTAARPSDRPAPPPASSAAGPTAQTPTSTPAPAPAAPTVSAVSPAEPGRARYGEAVVRELLGATFIGEQSLADEPAAPLLEVAADSAPELGTGEDD